VAEALILQDPGAPAVSRILNSIAGID